MRLLKKGRFKNKEVTKMLQPLLNVGWTLVNGGRGSHIKLYDATGKYRMVFCMDTGGRGLDNTRAIVKRFEREAGVLVKK